LLYNRPKHTRLIRYGVLYPLYALCEIAIISTDLAELLGSAIGLSLLFPSLPLWAAVLLTATDVLIFLFIGDPSRGQGRPVRVFELTIVALVLMTFPTTISAVLTTLTGVRSVHQFNRPPCQGGSRLATSLPRLYTVR